jgi:hypothetical protein
MGLPLIGASHISGPACAAQKNPYLNVLFADFSETP